MVRCPNYAKPVNCDCLGCRIFFYNEALGEFDSAPRASGTALGPPPPPLPPVNKISPSIDADIAQLDKKVNEAFASSYLAPLLPMTRSQNWEIRRGSITSVARLSDDNLRAAAAALRNLHGKSILADVLSFSLSDMCTMPQRREAVNGFVNLIGHRYCHGQLLADNLLPRVLLLLKECQQNASMRLVIPQVIAAIETLCNNDEVAPVLLKSGFVSELLTVATDTSTGDGLIALSMRRSAVQALVAMSKGQHAKIELKARARCLTGPVGRTARVPRRCV